MSITKLSLGGNYDVMYKLFLPRESDIPAGDGNIEKLFLRCTGRYSPHCSSIKAESALKGIPRGEGYVQQKSDTAVKDMKGLK
jgi:hypothetical protein